MGRALLSLLAVGLALQSCLAFLPLNFGGPPMSRTGGARWDRQRLGGEGNSDNSANTKEEGGLFDGIARWWEVDGKEDIRVYGTSLVTALLFRTFIVEPRFIPSLSMFPTFEVGDQLAVEKVTKLVRPYERRDVVVFHPPDAFFDFSSRGRDEALIKRVVAVAGDQVVVKGGKLLINGEVQQEDYVLEEPEYDLGPIVVPSGNLLVLGDNRNHSLDGHVWGYLPTENVIGRAVLKYWPPWHAGTSGLYQ